MLQVYFSKLFAPGTLDFIIDKIDKSEMLNPFNVRCPPHNFGQKILRQKYAKNPRSEGPRPKFLTSR